MTANGWRKRQIMDANYIKTLTPENTASLMDRHIEAAYQTGLVAGFAWACIAMLIGIAAIVITKGLL
jgi:hypothetical protein